MRDTAGHCAYCDGIVGTESRETIDHFQPSSKYHHLAYTWTNLLACCDQCQSKKGNEFSDLLLKPDEQGYRFEDFFVCNYHLGTIEANPAASPDQQEKAKVTIKQLGLNDGLRPKARLRELKSYENDTEKSHFDDWNYRFFLTP